MCLSPLTPPPGSGAAVWEAGAIPPLWSWLCGTQASRTLEAAGSRWHQTCHVCCTSLILAQAFPLPGNPVPAPPFQPFQPSRLNANVHRPGTVSDPLLHAPRGRLLLIRTLWFLVRTPYLSVSLTRHGAGLFIVWSPAF